MKVDSLITLLSILITLSIASERLAEIVKGMIPFLNQENPDPVKEGRRRSLIQILAVAAGVFTAFLASHVLGGIPKFEENSYGVFAFGLLASGGSAFWNSILEYVLKIKDIQEIKTDKAKSLKSIAIEREIKLKNMALEKAAINLSLPPKN